MSDDAAKDLERSRDAWRLVAAGTSLVAIVAMVGVMIQRSTVPAAAPAAAAAPDAAAPAAASGASASGASASGASAASAGASGASAPTGMAALPGTGLERFGTTTATPPNAPAGEDPAPAAPPLEGPSSPRRIALADGQLRDQAPTASPVTKPAPEQSVPTGAAPARVLRPLAAPTARAALPTAGGTIRRADVAQTAARVLPKRAGSDAPSSRAPTGTTTSTEAPDGLRTRDTLAPTEPPAGNFEARSTAVADTLAGLDISLHGDLAAQRPRGTVEPRRRNAWQAAASGSAPAAVAPQRNVAELMREARDLERSGNLAAASQVYRTAANEGHGAASLRLAELFLEGGSDLKRDYVAAVHWYSKAREQGADVPPIEKH